MLFVTKEFMLRLRCAAAVGAFEHEMWAGTSEG